MTDFGYNFYGRTYDGVNGCPDMIPGRVEVVTTDHEYLYYDDVAADSAGEFVKWANETWGEREFVTLAGDYPYFYFERDDGVDDDTEHYELAATDYLSTHDACCLMTVDEMAAWIQRFDNMTDLTAALDAAAAKLYESDGESADDDAET